MIIPYSPEMRNQLEEIFTEIASDPNISSLVGPGQFDVYFDEYLQRDGQALVYFKENVKGFIGWHYSSNYKNKQTGKVYAENEPFLHTLAVRESARGQGIGTTLVKECLQDVMDRDLTSIKVRTSNQKARDIYKALGFKEWASENAVRDEILWDYTHLKYDCRIC